ncbi:hypothetical protein RF11_01736 [Thelohanellus kitauei]|uniref:Uncharacterized protein n=1 Tax=Thelohanellus kitauei TaxID=669202 RepID=A0A0C2J2M7_THEKT|nr:hypothetical protein RF11_01736 [Thelohanellus kitauei]
MRNQINDFNIDDSGIMISFQGLYRTWFAIDCKLSNLDKYIEISGCYVSTKTSPQNPFDNFSIGYTLRLNKNTKYLFSTQKIRFKKGETRYPTLNINLLDLLVTFRGYTQKMVMESNENIIYCDLNSTVVIDDFSPYGGSYINVSVVDVQDEIEHKQGFSTTKKLLVLIISLMAVITSVIIFFVYNRCRQSRNNE